MRRALAGDINCVRAIIACAIVLVAGGSVVAAPTSEEYRNVDYAYAVTLPTGTHYEMSEPPASNHGFTVNLGPSVSVRVDSSSTDARDLAGC